MSTSKALIWSAACLAVVAVLCILMGIQEEKAAAASSQTSTRIAEIDNSLVRSVPQEQEVGWATATDTPSGVLIRASIRIGSPGEKKGGAK